MTHPYCSPPAIPNPSHVLLLTINIMPADRARRRSTRLATRPGSSVHETQLSFSDDEDMYGNEPTYMPSEDMQDRIFDPPSPETLQLSKRVQNAKQRKGSGYVPRAQNCFMIFRNAMIRSRTIPTGDMNNATISKVISNTWAAMPESEKKEWREKARQAKFQHSMQYPGYRYRPKHKPRKGKKKAVEAEDGDDVPPPVDLPVQPKTRAPRTKKIATTRGLARDEAQSEYVTSLLRQGVKGGDASEHIREWTIQWEAEHPQSEFPDDPVFDGQPSNEPTMSFHMSRPDSTSASSEEDTSAGYPEEHHYQDSLPAILAPVPSSATHPSFMEMSMGLGMGGSMDMGHRRSISADPYGMTYPGFYNEDPVQPMFQTMEDRSWLGQRRPSSVGALQYADMPCTSRRPSAANVLYPQAFQGSSNAFFPYLPPSFGTEENFLDTESQGSMFNPAFSFSSSGDKPTLPPMSLAPDEIPLARLDINAINTQWSEYSAGPSSSVSGPPSTIFTGSQTASPESMGHTVSLPQGFECIAPNVLDTWPGTHPIVPIEGMGDMLLNEVSPPHEEFNAMDDYLHFGSPATEQILENPSSLLAGNEVYHS